MNKTSEYLKSSVPGELFSSTQLESVLLLDQEWLENSYLIMCINSEIVDGLDFSIETSLQTDNTTGCINDKVPIRFLHCVSHFSVDP